MERATEPAAEVSVPAPAVDRSQLGDALQNLWASTERSVALLPPARPPAGDTAAAVAWARGPFMTWLVARAQSLRDAVALSESVAADPPLERALAAALLGHATEDLVARVHAVTAGLDQQDALEDTVRPLAVQALTYYVFCRDRLGDEDGLDGYCGDRARAITASFDLAADG